MKINIGKNIRELRRGRGLTQEQLAESMGVSFQAVSKWETGTALPDITMLPALAAYFNVTIDRLMSFDRHDVELAVEKICSEAYAFRESDPEKAREIIDKGLEEYPDNDVLLTNRLYVMDYSSKPDETIALASRIAAKTDAYDLRCDALRFLAYGYHAKGDVKSAVAALEQVPELYFTKLSEMAFITEGEQKRTAAEKQEWISFETLLQMLWKLAECCEADGDITGACAYARRALRLIEAMHDEKKISLFLSYRDFLNRQLDRLEKMP